MWNNKIQKKKKFLLCTTLKNVRKESEAKQENKGVSLDLDCVAYLRK